KMVTWDVRDVSRDSLFADRSPEGSGQLVRELSQIVHPADAADHLFQLVAPRLQKLPAALSPDDPATKAAKQAARAAVPLENDVYSPGDLLVKQDEEIKDEQFGLLQREHDEYAAQRSRVDRLQRTSSLAALVLGLCTLAGYYIGRFEPRVAASHM